MSAPGYAITTPAAVALAANTPKTVLAAIAGATTAHLVCCEMSVSFDGVTASEKPVLVELIDSTGATAGSGTSATIEQDHGHFETPALTALYNYASEPTVADVLRRWWVDPNKGLLIVQFPLGREPESEVGGSVPSIIGIRCTVPSAGAAVNAHATLVVEE